MVLSLPFLGPHRQCVADDTEALRRGMRPGPRFDRDRTSVALLTLLSALSLQDRTLALARSRLIMRVPRLLLAVAGFTEWSH